MSDQCAMYLLQGFDLSRTVLVDNDDYKAADGEHENMLHVPHWEQTPGERQARPWAGNRWLGRLGSTDNL